MHMSAEIVCEFLEQRLVRDQEAFWKQHLEICTQCAHYADEWRTMRITLRRAHLTSAADEDLRRAISIFPHSSQVQNPHVRTILASLIFDSFAEPAMAGLRGSPAATRQLVMHAEEFDIHVKIWGDADRRQMLGQLLPRRGQHFVNTARFHLLRNGERIESTGVDEIGEFHFSDVPDGDLSLQVDLPNLTVIGALNVKERL